MIDKQTSPESIILSKAVEFVTQKARTLIQESGMDKPPFRPEHVAHLQGVKRIVKADLGDQSGLLIPLQDGFEIKLNATHSPQRQNFSCAHEIAHTFFFEDKGKALMEKRRGQNKKGGNRLEEDLCDIAASELLMPSRIFTDYASRYHFSISSLTPLSRIFNTSIVPTALKLCDVNPRWCFLVYWARDKSTELNSPKLQANWLTWSRKSISPRTSRFLKSKVFGNISSVSKAYMSANPTYSLQQMHLGSFRGYCKIYSHGFGLGANRFVLSFVFPDSDN